MSFNAKKSNQAPMGKQVLNVEDSGGDESYEEDEFMDGEETTSKEIKRSAFEVESMTE